MANSTTYTEISLLQSLSSDMTQIQNKMNQLVQGLHAPSMDELASFKKLDKEFKLKHSVYRNLLLQCLSREQ